MYLSHFLYSRGLNFIFSSSRETFVKVVERRKVKKILHDNYVFMLTSRDNHADNHFSDNFVHLCYVGYFINDDGRKLTA